MLFDLFVPLVVVDLRTKGNQRSALSTPGCCESTEAVRGASAGQPAGLFFLPECRARSFSPATLAAGLQRRTNSAPVAVLAPSRADSAEPFSAVFLSFSNSVRIHPIRAPFFQWNRQTPSGATELDFGGFDAAQDELLRFQTASDSAPLVRKFGFALNHVRGSLPLSRRL